MPFGSGYGRRRGGGGARLILGAIIAIVALVMYFMRSEVNPVTGEKQRVAMNTEQEKALGLQAAPQMAQQMGGAIPTSDPRAAMVDDVGRRLVQQTDARKSPYVGNYNFYLLGDARNVNAFALPGGQIFITEALYERMENEAQLAGVLAHEIGHVVHRHAAEQMAKGQLGQMLVGAVAVGASDERGRGQMAAMAGMMVEQVVQLRFSRQDELESDAYGLRWMVQAGYDPTAMREVMMILKEAGGGRGGPGFLQTHPHPDARIEQTNRFLQENYPGGIPSELSRGRPLR
jgi:beta-barrel assembly-enhancing protease